MSEPESVEILIVSYNCRALLEDCLSSIEEHRPSTFDLRIRILDNCSTDGTPEMVEELFPQARMVRSATNLGFGRANNELARTSSADYLMLLNPDTRWQGDVVTPLLDCLRADPQVIAAGPKLVFPDGRRQASNRRLPSLPEEALGLVETVVRGSGAWTDRHVGRSLDCDTPQTVDFLWATCWLIRREDTEASGLFDEEFAMYDEDADFCARVRTCGRTLVYQPRAELVHVGGGSANAVLRGKLMRSAREKYYRRWRGRGTALAYHVLITTSALVGRLVRREGRTP